MNHRYAIIGQATQREHDVFVYDEPQKSTQVMKDFFAKRNLGGSVSPMSFKVKKL